MIRLYGEMRTGTNYLAVLLKRHFELELKWQQKHEPLDGREYDGTIIIVKDPYAWMWSMLNCQVVTKKTLYKGMPYRENINTDTDLQVHLITRFNEVYKSWLNANDKYIINYEKLLEYPKDELLYIEKTFGLKRITEPFLDELREVRSEERLLPTIFAKKEFYLNRNYMTQLTPRTKEIIGNFANWDMLEKEYNIMRV